MCDRIPRDYPLVVEGQYAYVRDDGVIDRSAIVADVWDIFPMADSLRNSNEREAVIGTDYSRRPYNATISGVLWREGNSPNGDIVKLYFRDFRPDGLPEWNNVLTIPSMSGEYRTGVNMTVTGVNLFGLSYADRLFACMLDTCTLEEALDGDGLPSIRCRDYFVNQVNDSTQDQIAISKFCDRPDPDGICIDLCSKTRDTVEQCQSILYTRCSNLQYAMDNPDICGCHMPISVYRDFIARLRENINNLDDRYAAIKSILSVVDYDPANPQCFYPACITSQYKGIHGDSTVCPDYTVCFQGIDLSADIIEDTQLNLLNECLIDRQIIPGTPSPGQPTTPQRPAPRPDNGTSTPAPRPNTGKGKGKDKNSTITWVAIGGGILLLVVVIAIAVSVSKKGSKK